MTGPILDSEGKEITTDEYLRRVTIALGLLASLLGDDVKEMLKDILDGKTPAS